MAEINNFDSNWWAIITIAGPIALALVLLWAALHNKTSKKRKADTERATAELYDVEARRDGMRPEKNSRAVYGHAGGARGRSDRTDGEPGSVS